MPEKKLAAARLRQTPLPVQFHVRDLCAIGALAIRPTASGPFVRWVSARARCGTLWKQ